MNPKNEKRKMEVYAFVTDFIEEYGVSPTTKQIADRLVMSKSTVSKYMTRLEEEGFLESFGRYRTVRSDRTSYSRMPVVGAIACGEPILAIEDVEEYIPIDELALGPGEYFGLIARGDSMINAGIFDGDIVYVRRQSVPDRDGDIVVAMIPDEETDGYLATLKRFFRDEKNNRYVLHPENDALEDIVLSEVHVVGVAVRVLKNIELPNQPSGTKKEALHT